MKGSIALYTSKVQNYKYSSNDQNNLLHLTRIYNLKEHNIHQMGKCENEIIADGAHWEVGKIRAPDGIWTHDPPWSSRML